MDHIVHEETHGSQTIKIHYDTDAESPRSWDNLGTMICGHRRYTLGDDHSFTDGRDFMIDLLGLDEESQLDIDALLARAQKTHIILPVYLYDHSGLAMNTTGFHCPWDSGQVGFIYVSLEDIRREYTVQRVSRQLRAKVAAQLASEVETYSDFLAGNVYGYVIEEDGDVTDSCWGFVGDYDGYCLQEARSALRASAA